MKHTIEEIKAMLEDDDSGYDCVHELRCIGNTLHREVPTIIRDLLAKLESYQRKHAEFGDIGRCPLARECSDEWGCEESWAKYWEEQ